MTPANMKHHVAICESKARFITKKEAKRYAKRLPGAKQAYRCCVCNVFHLADKNKSKEVRARMRDQGLEPFEHRANIRSFFTSTPTGAHSSPLSH